MGGIGHLHHPKIINNLLQNVVLYYDKKLINLYIKVI